MTDRIQNAIDALDKATPGPWQAYWVKDNSASYPVLHIAKKSTMKDLCVFEKKHAPIGEDMLLIAAAPDLAAEVIRLRKWKSKVLKRMEGWRDSLVETNDFGGLQYLDRLIAEAEGE